MSWDGTKNWIQIRSFSDNEQKAIFKGHMSSVRDKDKPFKCNICDFATTSMSNLMLHFSRIHEENKIEGTPILKLATVKRL